MSKFTEEKVDEANLCPGKSRAFGAKMWDEPHPIGRYRHKRCWSCGADLGCTRCSGLLRELLCMGHGSDRNELKHGGLGPVWATVAALVEHGPLRGFNQTVDSYPPAFASMYRATELTGGTR
jgi:hypothetical protein